MKKGKVNGLDGIPAKAWCAVWGSVAEDVHIMFNDHLNQGKFPIPWKNADLRIILKIQDRDPGVVKSCPQLSLLPTFKKLFERVVEMSLRHHVEENSLVSGTQFGFMKGRSVEDVRAVVVIRTEEMKAHFKYVGFLAVDVRFRQRLLASDYEGTRR